MAFDSRYSMAKVEQAIAQGYYGIPADSIAGISTDRLTELERKSCPWFCSFENRHGTLNGRTRPACWTKADTFLRKIFGTNVKYTERQEYPISPVVLEKKIGRYSSPSIQTQLYKIKSSLTEDEILKSVDVISENCDLRGTQATVIPKLKEVGGNLTLDAASKLEGLPLLKQIGGKLTVIAKSQSEMLEFLAKLGISKDSISITDGIHFVMKNFV